MHTENTSTSSRSFLSPEQLAPRASQQAAAFHADVINAVRQEVQARPVVVVGMAQNPWVKKARKALTDAGIQFTYLEYGSYLSKWKERLAIKLWSGWPTFPMVFVRGTLIGGYDLTVEAIGDGSLQRMLASTGTAPEARA